MSDELDHNIIYPTKGEIIAMHRDIIEGDEDAASGIINEGSIDYALNCIEHGHFGEKPETVHEKAAELMRLLAANHPFADGNKRTALNATWTFYALNGLYFDYGEAIKAILKLFAVMERMVDIDEVIEYFGSITFSEDDERAPSKHIRSIHLLKWLNDHDRRFRELMREVVEKGFPSDHVEDYFEMHSEFNDLADEFEDYREEYGDELAEETQEFIQGILDERDETNSFLQDLYEILEEHGELTEEHTEKLKEKYDLEEMDSEEMLDRLEGPGDRD